VRKLNARQKPKGINVLALLISIGGVMDTRNFLSLLIDPRDLTSASVISWFNFYILLPVGLFSLVVAYGFFKGHSWGWSLGIVSSFLGIIISIVNFLGLSIDPVTLTIIIINAFTVYYLTRPHVKKYFLKPVS